MRIELQHILAQISRNPNIDNGDLSATNSLILTAITQGLAVDRASIWLLSDNHQLMHCKYQLDGNQHSTPDLTLSRQDFPTYFNALDDERNIVAADAHQHPQTAEFSQSYLAACGICSMLDTPIRHHGVMVGIICIEHRQIKHWQTDDVIFAGFLADIYGRALSASERMRYQCALEQLNDGLEQIISQRTQELTLSLEQLQQTQHRLVEVEKMASLGRLVAGLAHEINTPLGVAVTAISHAEVTLLELEKLFQAGQLSRQKFSQSGGAIKHSIALVHANLQRTVDLVNSFKQTAAASPDQQAEWLVLSQFIPKALCHVASLLKQHQINIQLDLPAGLKIYSFASPLTTILIRLIENACQHAFDNQPSRQITIRARQNTYNWQLEIADNGRGMNTDELARAFEPFFTTRRNKGAKGLGMTLVFNLVTHLLQGDVSLHNTAAGCVVTLNCPLSFNATSQLTEQSITT